MKIGIDLDEVLADFLSTLIEFHNEKRGTSFKRNDFHSYRVYEVWGGTLEETIAEIYEFYETKFFDRVKPMPGALESVNELSRNHELIVITSRQLDISQKTISWIEKYFSGRFSGIFFTNQNSLSGKSLSKSSICRNSEIEFMVEDYLDYASECARSVKKVLLYDSPWNKTADLPENIFRVYSWKDISENLLNSEIGIG